MVLDGLPPQMSVDLEDLHLFMKRRAPGQLLGVTSRKEDDRPQIISGVFEGKTTGAPLTVIVPNTNVRSQDYDQLKGFYRPGHADRTTLQKYGIRDHRGGGRSSGRETVARVIGGYFAQRILPSSMKVRSFINKLGPFSEKIQNFSHLETMNFGPYSFLKGDDVTSKKIESFLVDCKERGESVGGEITTVAFNPMPGLGEPVFDKLKADLAKGILSIGACTSFSYGLGESFADIRGSEMSSHTNAFGGMEGGMTNGGPLIFKCTFRPTSTVGKKAREGRHDPCVLPRAVVVVESMASFVLADHYLRQLAYQGFVK